MGLLECCHLHPITSMHIGGRRQDVGRSLPGCRPRVGRASTALLIIARNSTALAHMSSELLPTPVSVLTGTGRLVQRGPSELRPKCDRVDFKRKIRSTPWRMWNTATFGRSTNSAGDRWICDIDIHVTRLKGRHISKTEPARPLCELKSAFSPGWRPESARSLRAPPRFLGIGRRSHGTETCS